MPQRSFSFSDKTYKSLLRLVKAYKKANGVKVSTNAYVNMVLEDHIDNPSRIFGKNK